MQKKVVGSAVGNGEMGLGVREKSKAGKGKGRARQARKGRRLRRLQESKEDGKETEQKFGMYFIRTVYRTQVYILYTGTILQRYLRIQSEGILYLDLVFSQSRLIMLHMNSLKRLYTRMSTQSLRLSCIQHLGHSSS